MSCASTTFPIAPVLIGLILGPLAEKQLRQALAIGQGDPMVLVSSPLSIAFLTIALGVLVVPPLLRLRRPAAA